MNRWSLLSPLLLAIYALTTLYANNIGLLSITTILRPVALVLVAILFLLWVVRRLLGDDVRAGLLATALVLLFFSYGHIYEALPRGEGGIGRHRYLLPVWAGLFTLAAVMVIRKGHTLRGLARYITVVAAVLVAISLGNVAVSFARSNAHSPLPVNVPAAPLDDQQGADDGETLPDIYYIVLDTYAREDTLLDYLEYDNHEFIDTLTAKGFYVASESRSNYSLTELSLASSLNMSYLDQLRDEIGQGTSSRAAANIMLRNSEVVRRLRASGYTIINVSSGWGSTNYYPSADINFGYPFLGLNEFEWLVLKTTLLNPLDSEITKGLDLNYGTREGRLQAFGTLETIPGMEEPTFVIAHMLLPHHPYVFDREGNKVDFDECDAFDWCFPSAYVDQLVYLNSRIEPLIEVILASSEVPPVIILQGDHGTRSLGGWDHAHESLAAGTPDQATEATLRESMSILNAYYLPADERSQLYASITPVNTFRLILDTYLGTDLGKLEDKSYFSTYEAVYEFLEVPE